MARALEVDFPLERKAEDSKSVLTQNVHLAPNTQQAEQAGFTCAKSHETCQSIFLKINKR
jgi:hypothetical protein